jgi:hypothetical protein
METLGKYVTSDCGDVSDHGPHTFRWGFLWLKKANCEGPRTMEMFSWSMARTPEEVDAWIEKTFAPPRHKHFYRIDRTQSDHSDIMFVCEKCGQERPTHRLSYMIVTGQSYTDWLNLWL